MTRKKSAVSSALCLFFLVLALTFFISPPAAADEGTLTDGTITVVTGDNYPPFSFRTGEGELQGISIDEWRLWEERNGIPVEITGMHWSDAVRLFEAGEYDVLETPMYTEERARKYAFSKSFARANTSAYFDSRIAGIYNADSLKGFSVAVLSGDISIDYLTERGITDIVEYDSYEDIISAAKRDEVTVFVMDEPQAEYYLYRYGIYDDFRKTEPLYSADLHRAVLKSNIALLDTIDAGFANITDAEYDSIEMKWYGNEILSPTDLRYALVIAFVFTLCVLLLFIWNRTLKATVKERTAELTKEVEARKLQAERLIESEQRFREIFDNINDGVALLSPGEKKGEMKILLINRAACEMSGYTAEELVSMDPLMIHAPDRRGDREKITAMLVVSDNGIIESEYRRKDGSTFPVETSLHTFRLGGKRVILSVIRDISERIRARENLEESEKRYRNVVEDQTELICRFGQDGTINFANSAFCRYFGLDCNSITGKKVDFNIFPEDRERLNKFFSSLTKKNPVNSIEHRIIMPDGELKWQSWSDRAVFDEDGNFVEYQSVGRDITDQKRKDEALALAAKKLNLLNQVTLAEIQNALFCEQGYLQLAMDLATDKKQKDYLEKQAETMDKVAITLDFAKNYQDLGVSPPEWYDFEKVFVFAISHTDTTKMDKRFSCRGVCIFADSLLERALSVLVSGALSYSTGTTSLSLSCKDIDKGALMITMAMNGKGINRESAARIFSRGGDPETGIDLFLTSEVLSITNISIKENGSLERGLCFEIVIPPGVFWIRDEIGQDDSN